ncbi:hypothetical protein ACHAQH_007110 [Verticillium albo-atrum]
MSQMSPLMRIPAELRVLIYEHLLDDGGNIQLEIRNKPRQGSESKAFPAHRRSRYRVVEKNFHQDCFETTYALASKTSMSVGIMGTNRQMYAETSHMIYARHTFSFAGDIEAVSPFFRDLSPHARSMVRGVSIRKGNALFASESDRLDWSFMCQVLRDLPALRHLRLVVEGGRPSKPGISGGLKALEPSDLRLLGHIQHDSVQWIAKLKQLKNLEEMEVVPELKYMPAPQTTAAILYASFSAAIGTAFVEHLREDCGLPAVACSQP